MAGLGALSSPVLAWERNDVSFRGCSEVWIVVADADIDSDNYDPPTVADVIVETKGGDLDCRRQYFTAETTTTIPGQFGDAPVLKYDVSGGEKILGVIIYNYDADNGGINPNSTHPLTVNPNNCANTPGTPNPSDGPCADNTYVTDRDLIESPGNGGGNNTPGNGNGQSTGNGRPR